MKGLGGPDCDFSTLRAFSSFEARYDTQSPSYLVQERAHLPQGRANLAQGRADLAQGRAHHPRIRSHHPAYALAFFLGVCWGDSSGIFLFSLCAGVSSAGFCGGLVGVCFDEPAAWAITAAGAASSPGRLTILRIAATSAWKISGGLCTRSNASTHSFN